VIFQWAACPVMISGASISIFRQDDRNAARPTRPLQSSLNIRLTDKQEVLAGFAFVKLLNFENNQELLLIRRHRGRVENVWENPAKVLVKAFVEASTNPRRSRSRSRSRRTRREGCPCADCVSGRPPRSTQLTLSDFYVMQLHEDHTRLPPGDL